MRRTKAPRYELGMGVWLAAAAACGDPTSAGAPAEGTAGSGTSTTGAETAAADETAATEECEEPSHAPVPDGAHGVPIDFAVGYAVEPLGGGLHFVTNGVDQVIFAATGEGVVLVDAPPGMVDAIAAAIAGVTDEPITHVVYSHYHHDHIGGAGQLAPAATFVAHAATATELERAADPDRPVPTVTFEDDYTLTVGSQVLELGYHGPNHVDGNISVLAPEQGVLMMVDVVWPGWVPFVELGQAEHVPGYVDAFDEILAFDFDVFVGGHVGRYGTRQDVEDVHAYVLELREHAGAALGAVSFDEIAQEVGYENTWLLVDRYFDALATHCAEATIPGWVDRLGGADVWTKENCFAMIQSLRID